MIKITANVIEFILLVESNWRLLSVNLIQIE